MDPTPDPNARRMIEEFAADAARRSGLPEPQRSEARTELESHLFDASAASAKGRPVGVQHAKAAILALGSPEEVDAAFFAPHRSATMDAGWGRRLLALLIDGFLVAIVVGLVLVPIANSASQDPCKVGGLTSCSYSHVYASPCVAVWTTHHFEGPSDKVQQAQDRANDPVAFALDCAVMLVVGGSYFMVQEAIWGATLGKRALGLRVVRKDGQHATAGPAIGRNVAKLLGLLLLLDWVVGLLAYRGQHQRLSDAMAGTRVVRNAP